MSNSDKKIILFREEYFKGPGLVLFQTTNLDSIPSWDRKAKSLIIISGTWTFNNYNRHFGQHLDNDQGKHPKLDVNYYLNINKVTSV